MSSHFNAIVAAIQSDSPISSDSVLHWMDDRELRNRGAVYHLLRDAGDRIAPPVPANEQLSFMLNYLFDCLLQNPESEEFLHSGFEAAWELADCVKYWANRDDTQQLITQVVHKLTEEYRVADKATQNRIETGVVEHLMEKPALRPYFAAWKDDPTLSEAYRLCMLWGETNEQV